MPFVAPACGGCGSLALSSQAPLVNVHSVSEMVNSESAVPTSLTPIDDEYTSNGTYIHTSVDALRRAYGAKRHWFGDLDWVAARQLYHSLLPTHLIDDEAIPLDQRARMAVSASYVCTLYVVNCLWGAYLQFAATRA